MTRFLPLLFVLLAGAAACSRPPSPRGTIAPEDVRAPPAEAIRTSTGLTYRILTAGHGGHHPGENATVTLNYTGWTQDGNIVEGVPVGDPPATFKLSDTMPGLREGMRMMTAGEKWRFWIPANLAYGDAPGKPRGTLVYDIYLVQFVD